MFQSFPFLEVFLGFLGFGLAILFCTSFCRSCSRIREEQIEREAQMRREQEIHLRSIYFIPFPSSISRRDSEGLCGSDTSTPPQHSPTVFYEPPPSYNELGIKPDDLPPTYTEHSFSDYSTVLPPSPANMISSHVQSDP